MKTKYGRRWLSIANQKDMKMVKMRLMDDSEWEYDRVGIGTYKGQVFLVDLDDTGETFRVMNFVKKERQTVQSVINFGLKYKVFTKEGYDDYRAAMFGGDVDGFYGMLQCPNDNLYYSFMEKE